MIRGWAKCNGRRRRPERFIGWLVLVFASAVGCGSDPAYYRGGVTNVSPKSRVAVLPLVNLTRDESAADVVMSALVVELLAADRFTVVDPGIVQEEVQKQRLRLTDRLSLDALRALGTTLGVDYVFEGTVNEYQMVRDTQEDIPAVSIALRMVSCSTGDIVWAATHSKRGDDRESVFRFGRVDTLEELTALTAREMARTCAPESGATPEVKP